MPEYRAHFGFDIRFANGGEIAGTGFRLDVPSDSLSTDEIGLLLVQHLGLALVDDVELRGLRIVEEPHRGSRGMTDADVQPEWIRIDLPAESTVSAVVLVNVEQLSSL